MAGKTILSLVLLSSYATAYPFAMDINPDLEARQTSPPQGAGALPLVPPPFDAGLQYVSNTGKYKFVAPGRNDARGPCPVSGTEPIPRLLNVMLTLCQGLNAMANHGYLPHNGVATIAQFQTATSMYSSV